MGNEALIMMLRRQAVETLQKSTKMLEQAMHLSKEGNRKEAEKLRTVARVKRSDSIWLMGKANKFEQESLSAGQANFQANSALIRRDFGQPTGGQRHKHQDVSDREITSR